MKLWRRAGDERPLGAQELAARAVAGAIPGYRALPVLEAGAVGSVEYLCEPVVFGRHPSSPRARRSAADDLLPSLAAAYVAAGIDDRPLSAVYRRGGWRQRLKAVLVDPRTPWDPAFDSRRQVARRLSRLIGADRRLPCALGHGDIVVTNIIRAEEGRHVLTDWEMAGVMPVAFDLCKLLFVSGDPGAVQATAADALMPFAGGRRRYRWHEQLALGVAWHVAASATRRDKALVAGRLQRFEAELLARLRWLADLLR